MTKQTLFDQAVEAANGIGGLAQHLGISYKAVHQWRKRGIPTPWQRVIASDPLLQPVAKKDKLQKAEA